MSNTTAKNQLRYELKMRLNSLSPTMRFEGEQKLIEQLESQFALNDYPKNVLSYWSFGNELPTHNLNEKLSQKCKVWLPVIVGDHLVVKPFNGKQSMIPEPKFGILEPIGSNLDDLSIIDIVLVPGLGFNENGQRIGRGKGYYDGILPQLTNAVKIGVCFKEQLQNKIPTEPHDVTLDKVLAI